MLHKLNILLVINFLKDFQTFHLEKKNRTNIIK